MPGAGDSSQNSVTNSNSNTNGSFNTSNSSAPWLQAQPEVQSLIGGVQGLTGTTGVNPTERSAIDSLTATGAAGNPYAGTTATTLESLLHGGNATSEIPFVNSNYGTLENNLTPYTSPNYSTIDSPAVQAALNQVKDDVTNQVNGEFQAGGRSGSGMNQQTLARGIAQGEAPIILNQANTDNATRMNAIDQLFNGGNTTAGTIAGMNQTAAGNEHLGIGDTGTVLNNSLFGPQTQLEAQELGQTLPTSNLAKLAQIGIPLAELGSTSNNSGSSTSNTVGNSNTNTENHPSLLSELTSLGGLFSAPAGGTSAAAGLGQAAAGLGSAASGGIGSLLGLLAL